MKRAIIVLLSIIAFGAASAQAVYDSAWRADVKTVQLYRGGAEMQFPVLKIDERARMVLEFDVLRAEPENLRWRIVHCNRYWQPDQLEPQDFMTGFEFGPIDSYEFSFTTLTDYVHYRATLPGDFAEFTHSGNYILYVETEEEEPQTLLSRRFCVSEESAAVQIEITKPYDGVDIEQRQEVDVLVGPRGIPINMQYLTVVAQQNRRIDNQRELVFSGYDGQNLSYRNRKANIFSGGNTFRFFDCSNLRSPMYNIARIEDYGGELYALLQPCEDRSRKHFLSETTLNGGMKVNAWDRNNPRLEADYLWVNFTLPAAQPWLDASIYVIGELTNWQVDSASKMTYNPERKAYTARILLKQGYYAYQLLATGPAIISATARVEGDHRETPNNYTVYVYHHSPADRADRLIAIGQR